MKNSILILFVALFASSYAKSQNPIVEITTELGTIEVELYVNRAPITAQHFLDNVEQNIYKDACFYRVVRPDNQPNSHVKIEVIQAGLYDDSIVNKMPVIAHENTKQTGIYHKDGVISMARLQPGSASTEFFICIGDQPELDFNGKRNPDGQGFAAFGKVIRGMNIVRQIQAKEDAQQMLIHPIPIRSIKKK